MKVDVVLDTESQVVDVEVGNRIVTEIKPVLHDETVVGDGIETPMGVNTDVIATKEDLASKADKATTLSGYGITDAYTKAETDAKIGAVYHVKGSVADYDSLPDGASIGDVYNLLDTGANYVWTDNGWDKLSETVDLLDYATKGELESKQDKLTAGENITIEDGIISATGGGASLPDLGKEEAAFLRKNYKNELFWDNAQYLKNEAANPTYGTSIGNYSSTKWSTYSTALNGEASQLCSLALGYGSRSRAEYAIMIGRGINTEPSTLKIGFYENTREYKLLDSDGTIPAARHAALPTEDGTYVLKCVISGGVPTMTWVKE